ncbi:MAG: NAD(P)-binding protein [Actinomycetia bacterium]|nr:NAD(P)-binding protein [Actinomycetes bacterium]
MGDRPSVAIVGAGITGLTSARTLRSCCDVVVLDKARGVGGRMATRRIGEATIDHGAQFLTTHTGRFTEMVGHWEAEGIATPWFSARVGTRGLEDQAPEVADGHIRYRGVRSMNDIAKHLAGGSDVRREQRVESVSIVDGAWRLRAASYETHVDAVILTAPVPQSLQMIEAGQVQLARSDREALDAIAYDPCLAALVPLSGPSGLPEPGAVDPASGPIDWMADNQTKGVSESPAVTIHASAEESRRLWRSPDEAVLSSLLGAAELDSPPIAGASQVQRWRYARPVVSHPDRCLVASGLPPLVLAGDAFGEPRVEGAVLSGLAAAAAIARLSGVAQLD